MTHSAEHTLTKIIDGKATAQSLRNQIAMRVAELVGKGYRPPGLSVILVGTNPASEVYVRNKAKACTEVGIRSEVITLPDTLSEEELLSRIAALNVHPEVDGILVQQPLPKGIDDFRVTMGIIPEKDVDGFHPENVGKLVIGKVSECFPSCTPYGVIELMQRYGIETEGKHAVIVGRSNIVGKPMANLLIQKLKGMNATVTVCHSATPDLGYFTRQADILIAAIGKAQIIKSDMVKPGAVVIDVGMNEIVDSTKKSGKRLVGDVEFEGVSKIASAITPVPGGVGPMTIAMLLHNTLRSYEKRILPS